LTLIRCRKLVLAALLAALLLEGVPQPVAEAGSRRAPARSEGGWQPIPRASSRQPSIKAPSANGSVGSSLSPAFPTVNQPAVAPSAPGFSSHPSSRSMGWVDMGNGARMRAGARRPAADQIMPDPLSLIPDSPADPPFPLSQLAAATAAPAPQMPSLPAQGAGMAAPVTGAQPLGLVPPSAAPQGASSLAPKSAKLTSELKLPAGMNLSIRSLDFRQTEVQDALRSLATLINLNLMLANDISGNVTVLFSDVTVEEAFNTLLRSFNLGYSWDGTILRIFKSENAPLMTKIFPIRNTNATAIKPVIDPKLTATRGSCEVDTRTNSLVITDTAAKIADFDTFIPQLDIGEAEVDVTARPVTEVFYLNYIDASVLSEPIKTVAPNATTQAFSSSQASQAGAAGGTAGAGRQDMMIITDTPNNLERVREIIEKLDIAPLQVTINAHIYEIDLNEEERLGINWQKQIPIPGTTENVFDMSITPEDAAAGGTGVFRFGSLTVNQFRALLAMLKTHSFAKVLSNPVITTLNNRKANITVGQSIPYVSASQVNAQTGQVTNTVQTANANITLDVTPSVTGNDEVFLDITPTISSVLGFTSLSGNSTPNLSNRTAQTQVIVKNNHTIVIGGMIKTDKSDSISKVPFLGDLPGIGKLFQKKTVKETRTELIIFITPHIVRPTAKSPVAAQNSGAPRLSMQ